MNANERLLTEAIKTYLQQKPYLGVPEPSDDFNLRSENNAQHLHEHITDAFAVKASDLVHFEGVCRAFNKIHSYKYVTDPNFKVAFLQEMTTTGVPGVEQQKALKFVDSVIKEAGDGEGWCERDAGFHPDLDEIIKVSKPGVE